MAENEVVRTTCPRDCYDSCGIAVVKRDGVVRKVLGDPDHPVSRGGLCGKCALAYNGVWRDPEERLTVPLRRSAPRDRVHSSPFRGTKRWPRWRDGSRLWTAPACRKD